MLFVKKGASLTGLAPQLALAACVVDRCYERNATPECWITSGADGEHSAGSKHYVGCALDFRVWNIPSDQHRAEILEELRQALGRDFDVIDEGDHIHVEWDPKNPI